ncbi:MAG: nitroreductase family protein, partial [Bacteroidota bacterium]
MKNIRVIGGFEFEEYVKETYDEQTVIERSKEFYEWMDKRRTVRDFSDKPIPKEVIDNILLSASTAPSGAHKQPWSFCVVSSPELKKKIREAAEKEEYESYNRRMSEEWLEDLKPLQTD